MQKNPTKGLHRAGISCRPASGHSQSPDSSRRHSQNPDTSNALRERASVNTELAAWFWALLELGSDARLEPPLLSWDMVRLAVHRAGGVEAKAQRLRRHDRMLFSAASAPVGLVQ